MKNSGMMKPPFHPLTRVTSSRAAWPRRRRRACASASSVVERRDRAGPRRRSARTATARPAAPRARPPSDGPGRAAGSGAKPPRSTLVAVRERGGDDGADDAARAAPSPGRRRGAAPTCGKLPHRLEADAGDRDVDRVAGERAEHRRHAAPRSTRGRGGAGSRARTAPSPSGAPNSTVNPAAMPVIVTMRMSAGVEAEPAGRATSRRARRLHQRRLGPERRRRRAMQSSETGISDGSRRRSSRAARDVDVVDEQLDVAGAAEGLRQEGHERADDDEQDAVREQSRVRGPQDPLQQVQRGQVGGADAPAEQAGAEPRSRRAARLGWRASRRTTSGATVPTAAGLSRAMHHIVERYDVLRLLRELRAA